ncbi:Sin-like protein conserved region-domain-containing protein [Copromyces sp. CBS 386.78]|nr:Sin-like protein conserved region-domain-containing protein [Copromyces sp. CBS 386.78]
MDLQRPTTTNPSEDDDPIVATYNVFIKPPLPSDRKLVVLRYVTKTAQDPSSIKPPRINSFRVKPETGIYEVDIPLETADGYNKGKGIAWGVALAKSMESKKGGSLGLAGGFNIGGQGGSSRGGPGAAGGGGRRAANNGDEDEAQNLSWPEAVAQGKAIIDQKLTGSRSAGEDYVKHMVGVFQGNNLHLTPVTSLVQLRPVAPYLDAATEQERLSRLGPGPAANGPADKQAAGRAIHMSIKSSDTGGAGAAAETMADRLRAVQTEPWHNLKWYHDEHGEAWDTYNECMLLRSSKAANGAPAQNEEDEEKKKEKAKEEKKDGEKADAAAAAAEPTDDSGAPDLVEKVNRLQSDWGEEQILRSINGLGPDDKKPGEEAVSVPSVFGTKKATATTSMAKKVQLNNKGKGKADAMQLD